jgi:hypothetical protein
MQSPWRLLRNEDGTYNARGTCGELPAGVATGSWLSRTKHKHNSRMMHKYNITGHIRKIMPLLFFEARDHRR